MIRFNDQFLEAFLTVVRKYMQLRGGLTQKDLSEMTNVGISTMSRFLNLKTNSVDEQLVANIIASLEIPLTEIIDGIEEDSTDTFKRLVQFYKDQKSAEKDGEKGDDDAFAEGLGGNERNKTKTTATINLAGRKQEIPFGEAEMSRRKNDMSLREKLQTLSPRQKAYITDFLDLEVADRDLIVDLGDAIFRYVRQRSVDF